LGFEIKGDSEKNAVTIDDGAARGNEESAIGVAVKGNAKGGAFCGDTLPQFFEMERTAAGVDVAAVGFGADRNDVAAEGGKKFGAELISGAVGAIKNDANAFQRSACNYAAAKKIQVLVVERIVWTKRRQSE